MRGLFSEIADQSDFIVKASESSGAIKLGLFMNHVMINLEVHTTYNSHTADYLMT